MRFHHHHHTYLTTHTRSNHQQSNVRDNDHYLNNDNYREIAFLHTMNVSSIVRIKTECIAFFLMGQGRLFIIDLTFCKTEINLKSINFQCSPVNDSIPIFATIQTFLCRFHLHRRCNQRHRHRESIQTHFQHLLVSCR